MLYLLWKNKEAYLELSPMHFLYLIFELKLSYPDITHIIPFQGKARLFVCFCKQEVQPRSKNCACMAWQK